MGTALRNTYLNRNAGVNTGCPATFLRPRCQQPRFRWSVRVNASAAAGAALPTSPQLGRITSAVDVLRQLPQAAKNFADWWKIESPAKTQQSESPVKLGPVLAKLWSLCAPDVPLLLLASSFMVMASVCELSIPHFATKSIFAASEGSTAFHGYLSILTCMVTLYGVGAALRGFCFSILNNRMTRRLRTELFASLARRETAFFDGEDVGNLTSRLQTDCQAMTKVIATNANIAVRNLLQAVGGIIYLYVLSPPLCGITVAISAVLWAVTLVYGSFAKRMQKIFQDVLAESNSVAEETLSLSRVVRTFGTEGVETRRYTSWLDRLYQVGKRQAAGYALFVAAGHIACYASKVAALAVGCGMVLTGNLTAEQLTNFIMYVEFVTYASLNVCDEFTEICEAVGASERVVGMLGAPPAPQIAAGATLPTFRGQVTLRDVSFSYPSRPSNMALDGVSLTFPPGKLTALVGLSGSGKTTVCGLLQRLYDPTSGQMLLDDTLDLQQADAAWYRTQIGVVPQEPRLFSRSIAANIAYGMEHDSPSQEDIEEAARAANAHEFIMALPEGYNTLVTDKLLSGGQRQRLALARALVRKPKLLVLDEFSSALDAESEAQVHVALDRAMSARDRTVVVIAHRLSTVRHADCIVVMDKGKVYEMGSHHELLGQRGIYWQLVCRQQYGIDPANAAAATDTDSDTILAAAAAAVAASGGMVAVGALHGDARADSVHDNVTGSVADSLDAEFYASSNGNGSVSSRASSYVDLGSPGSTEEDVLHDDSSLLGAATDDAFAAGHGGSGGGADSGAHGGMLGSMGSMAGSMGTMGTMDEDNDEAGRPATAGAGAGRMSAVLAGIVVTAAATSQEQQAELQPGAQARQSGA
ncbi:hypothetical protein PLESTB_001790300 [Pleodorina starrii]|uniref:Uncharacterized protein n=1 Tax=Pleodorina starrii TaxID=330485 RepID=A0A9W6F9R6_9CHLO|nr:hypothetical protein PLESTM_001760800 [Pleodorina starrii]GLC61677.1 hypothetical protein PLESTB_001790300 [Pleodorina starrii]GLC76501.1 hypothetical protein PLESTF_001789600 [Pleodorina starrii]